MGPPPGPFLADALCETQLQDHIEAVVRGLSHRAEDSINLLARDELDRYPTSQVDVAQCVEREADAT